jgi:hypothetical protein
VADPLKDEMTLVTGDGSGLGAGMIIGLPG